MGLRLGNNVNNYGIRKTYNLFLSSRNLFTDKLMLSPTGLVSYGYRRKSGNIVRINRKKRRKKTLKLYIIS
jgi:hypothetical protein